MSSGLAAMLLLLVPNATGEQPRACLPGASCHRCTRKRGLFLPVVRSALAPVDSAPAAIVRPDRAGSSEIVSLRPRLSLLSRKLDGDVAGMPVPGSAERCLPPGADSSRSGRARLEEHPRLIHLQPVDPSRSRLTSQYPSKAEVAPTSLTPENAARP